MQDVPAALLKQGDNELFVLADNRFNHTTAPMHTGGDFWHYGGRLRRGTSVILPPAFSFVWRIPVGAIRGNDE